MSVRSIPNMLGYFRIIATPILLLLILADVNYLYTAAAALLLVMAISDVVDGKLARKLHVVSPLGIFLDTTSDKIFIAGALIPMVERGMLPSWVAFVIIVRDFAVSGLRSFAAAEGHVISAREWGKQKLTITITAIVWRLVAASMLGPTMPAFQMNGLPYDGALLFVAQLANLWWVPMGLAIIWTVFSGAEYFWKAWPMLMGQPDRPPVALKAKLPKLTLNRKRASKMARRQAARRQREVRP